MASRNRTTLKGYFETGDTPSQAQYADLIDSNLNLSETTAQQVSSDIHTSDTIMFNNSNTSGITYADNTGNVRYGLQFSRTSNLVSLTNNAANGFVQIKANGSSAGSGGEVTSSIFTNYSNEFLMHVTASGNISASGFISASNIISRFNVKAQTLVGTGVEATEIKTTTLVATNDDQNLISTSGTGFTMGQANYPLTITPNITASGNISASGTITGNNLKLDGSQVDFTNLPTSDPNVAGRLYNDGGSLKISAG